MAERPPWEQDAPAPPWSDPSQNTLDGPGNGHAAAPDDWQPWQASSPPAKPASSARPPWEDATPDGKSGGPAPDPAMYVPAGPAGTLTAAFAKAAGVAAATETLNGIRERRAASFIGWPPAKLADRLRGSGATSTRKLLASAPGDAPQAQRSDIDNAITVFADEVGGPLPEPWSRTVRAAARSRASEAQGALGAAVAQGLPPRDKVTGWWRLIALAQGLLMLLAAAGVVWIALILALHGSHKSSSLISDVSLAPWLGVMVIALLLLGWLIESWCQNMVVLAVDREREQANQAIMARVGDVTSDLVLAPAGRELADYEHFRTELAAARGPVTHPAARIPPYGSHPARSFLILAERAVADAHSQASCRPPEAVQGLARRPHVRVIAGQPGGQDHRGAGGQRGRLARPALPGDGRAQVQQGQAHLGVART